MIATTEAGPGQRPTWAGKTLAELTGQEIGEALVYLAGHHPEDEALPRALVASLDAAALQSLYDGPPDLAQ
ncbi:hypothetical protein ACGFNU_39185 [Spirillospora sp. NPDC048911]|uniref:hypothetical protein n=1 Tax=Spirillospora sp. NPDC048911 TaxID=3364527 RepID=UPI003713D1F2